MENDIQIGKKFKNKKKKYKLKNPHKHFKWQHDIL